MKQRLLICFLACLGTLNPLLADYDMENVGYWDIEAPSKQLAPYQLEVAGDWIGDSKFTEDSIDGDHIRYGWLEAEFEAVGYYDECHQEGLHVVLSFEQTRLDWDSNPFFDRRNFNTATLSLLGFTHRLCDWAWVGQFRYNIDANNWNFIDTSTYDFLVWGRYAYRRDLGLHVGLFAETGIRWPVVLPVIGFDWRCLRYWTLTCVFPLNISVAYALDNYWNLRLSGRWWNDRHRVGEHEHLHKAIWRYTNYGVEIGADYGICGFKADVHGGIAFGGRVKVANHRGHETKTFRFKPAAYFGGEILMEF